MHSKGRIRIYRYCTYIGKFQTLHQVQVGPSIGVFLHLRRDVLKGTGFVLLGVLKGGVLKGTGFVLSPLCTGSE